MEARRQVGDSVPVSPVEVTTPISLIALVRLLRDPSVVVVEALGPDFYADAHLPGAINIPASSTDELAPDIAASATGPVVVYASRTCGQAGVVAAALEAAGASDVRVFDGGKEEWVEAGLPVERDR